MGYMGFGMQKWIYTQRPRKPFSKRKKETGDTIDTYSARDLIISGRTHKTVLSNEEKNRVLQRLRRRSIHRRVVNTILALSLIVFTIIIIVKFKPWDNSGQSGQSILEEERNEMIRKSQVFEFSMEFGKNYFKKGDFGSAVNEFHQALEVFPNSKEARDYLIRSYVQDCILNNQNCEHAKIILDKLIIENPDNYNYQSYRISLDKIKK